jgi:EAL domain-containing protein (putative c-di-GMP-specific phosphodiesterase class I)
VDLDTGRMIGVEALLRWEHPQRGLVSPGEFIPLAEETGMILPIGLWVLREACAQARHWQETYPGDDQFKMSVNLSAKQFQQPGLVEDIARILEETGLEPRHLELEITESAVMLGDDGREDAQVTVGQLQALKSLGVQLAVDDFGTGYSSLSYLEHFPLDVLKIDQRFVKQIGLNGSGMAIMQAVHTLGQALSIKVTAEGVENIGQLEKLRALDCHVGQGYHFSKPLPAAGVEALLQQSPRW